MTYINPLYIGVFHDQTVHPGELESEERELIRGAEEIDFSMTTEAGSLKAQQSVVEEIALLSLKTILLPWGLCEAVGWGLQRAAMTPIYPAQSTIVQRFDPYLQLESIDGQRFKIYDQIVHLKTRETKELNSQIENLNKKEKKASLERLALLDLPESLEEGSAPAARIQRLDAKIHSYQKRKERLRERLEIVQEHEQPIVRHVTFETDGVRVSGVMIAAPSTVQNGKWVLQATGNMSPIEYLAPHFAYGYQDIGFNVLLVNNPGIGRSEGITTPESMGAVHNTAIEFLKEAVHAREIVLAGYSIGGASIGQAILQRDLTRDRGSVEFLVLRQVTFAKMSQVAENFVPASLQLLANAAVRGLGCEMDNTAASAKLAEHGIPEVTIQAEDDDIVPWKHSLQAANKRRGINQNSDLPSPKPLKGVTHNDVQAVLKESCWQIEDWCVLREQNAAAS